MKRFMLFFVLVVICFYGGSVGLTWLTPQPNWWAYAALLILVVTSSWIVCRDLNQPITIPLDTKTNEFGISELSTSLQEAHTAADRAE